MKYKVTIGEDVFEVVIDGRAITIDGEPVTVDVLSPHLAVIDGHNVFYDTISKRLVNIENDLFDVKLEPVLPIKRPEGAAGAAGAYVAKASMPGKIVRVAVKPGDKVEAQQLLYVLEAMKMENEVLSEEPGTVKEIHKAAGDTVETDEQVITLGA